MDELREDHEQREPAGPPAVNHIKVNGHSSNGAHGIRNGTAASVAASSRPRWSFVHVATVALSFGLGLAARSLIFPGAMTPPSSAPEPAAIPTPVAAPALPPECCPCTAANEAKSERGRREDRRDEDKGPPAPVLYDVIAK